MYLYWLCFIYVSMFGLVSYFILFTVYLLVVIVYSNYDRKKKNDNRVVAYWKEIWIFACYEKKKTEFLINLIGSKPFPAVLYFLCQKAYTL